MMELFSDSGSGRRGREGEGGMVAGRMGTCIYRNNRWMLYLHEQRAEKSD